MKIKNKISQALQLTVACYILIGAVACNDSNSPRSTYDNYPEIYHPAKVTMTFPSKSRITPPTFHIDNSGMKIYNPDPMPYGTQIDSAYIKLIISNQCNVLITNKQTGVQKEWHATDTAKIDITGGKLTITVARKADNEQPINYDLNIRIYGYNPNKLTWQPSAAQLPTASEDGAVLTHNGANYWITRLNNMLSLYRIDAPKEDTFTPVAAVLPEALQPKSITPTHNNTYFGINDKGELFYTSDLTTWHKRDLGNVRLTMLLYDRETDQKGGSIALSAVGHTTAEPNTFYSYTITEQSITRGEKLDSDAPVRNAYIYSYLTEEVKNANIIGGLTAENKPVAVNRFTTDGVVWAPMPYTQTGTEYPTNGALYIPHGDRSIYMVGGLFPGNTPNHKILLSSDRGVTWKEVSKDEEISAAFSARTGVSGMIEEDGKDLIFYLYGGKVIGGSATKEIWKGYIDRTGGILNEIEK